MKSIKLAWIASVAMLCAGCAATNQQRTELPEETRELLANVPIPETVAKLSVQDSTAYSDPALGVSYQYGGDVALLVDVYVYPLGEQLEKMLFEKGEQQVLDAGYQDFIDEMDAVVSQGVYESYTVLDRQIQYEAFRFTTDDGRVIEAPYQVLRAALDIRSKGQDFTSFIILSEFKDYFVKIRATHPEYPGLIDNVELFSDGFFENLYRNDIPNASLNMKVKGGNTLYFQLPGESISGFMKRAIGRMIESGAAKAAEKKEDDEKAEDTTP